MNKKKLSLIGLVGLVTAGVAASLFLSGPAGADTGAGTSGSVSGSCSTGGNGGGVGGGLGGHLCIVTTSTTSSSGAGSTGTTSSSSSTGASSTGTTSSSTKSSTGTSTPGQTITVTSGPTTKVVDWATSLAGGVKTPTGPNDVTWPQTLVTTVPSCGTGVIQEDTYKYSTVIDKGIVDLLVKGKKLNRHLVGKTYVYDDSLVVISWKFIVLKPCVTTTSSSPSTTSSSPSTTSSSPSTTNSTTTSSAISTATSTSNAAKSESLPNTGAGNVPLIAGFGLLLTLAGGGLTFLRRSTGKH